MAKRGVVFCVVVLLMIMFVFAIHDIGYSEGGTTKTILEDVETSFINITVNNTDPGNNSNITTTEVILDSSFTFIYDTNGTSAVANFTNSSTVYLNWTNTTWFLVEKNTVESFWFNVTASTPGTYNITVITRNATASVFTNLTITVNDTTSPNITYVDPTEANNSNLSRSYLSVNVSTADNVGLDTIIIELFNSTMDSINSSTNSTTSATLYVNFSSLSDGVYYFNATANDSAGNSNTTDTRNVTIDTTAPLISSFTCSPSSVLVGGVISCDCTGSDALDSNPTIDFVTEPSTTAEGTFSTSCSITDAAGNLNVSNVTYTVIARSSSSPGGGSAGSGMWKKTYVADESKLTEGYEQALKVEERLRVKISGSDHYVGMISIGTSSVTINVSSPPQQATVNIGEEKKFDVSGDGYYDMAVRLNSITGDSANVIVTKIHEEIVTVPEEESIVGDSVREETVADPSTSFGGSVWFWVILGVLVVVIGVIGWHVYKERYGSGSQLL